VYKRYYRSSFCLCYSINVQFFYILSQLYYMPTTDKVIRKALRLVLRKEVEQYKREKKLPAEIFEELGVAHGTARIDLAVINGAMHGYEIKSDKDTLERLPEQMKEYNDVFDKITLIVGKRHLYHAVNTIPDWWGIVLAKTSSSRIVLQEIRAAGENKQQVSISIARLLWRAEALRILEEEKSAQGFKSKTRAVIYAKLAETIDPELLKRYVRDTLLISRKNWRSDARLVLCGD